MANDREHEARVSGSAFPQAGGGRWSETALRVDSMAPRYPRLLPSIAILAGLHVVILWIGAAGGLKIGLLAACFLAWGVLAVTILKARDAVRSSAPLRPSDHVICRWSGVLAIVVTIVTLVGWMRVVRTLDSLNEIERSCCAIGFEFACEVSTILAVVCVSCPRHRRHVWPAWCWKIAVIPVFCLNCFVVALMTPVMVGQFADPDGKQAQEYRMKAIKGG